MEDGSTSSGSGVGSDRDSKANDESILGAGGAGEDGDADTARAGGSTDGNTQHGRTTLPDRSQAHVQEMSAREASSSAEFMGLRPGFLLRNARETGRP